MARVEVVWVPLGAGGSGVVRWSGRAYERWCAARDRRAPSQVFHAGLLVTVEHKQNAIEMGPQWDRRAPGSQVAVVGPVGTRWLGRSRWFRYQVRLSTDGRLPDARWAAAIVPVTRSVTVARAVLDLLPAIPRLTWGRDELRVGEMWNSNSVVAWLLTAAGVEVGALQPPGNGRAPGWASGVAAARAHKSVGVPT